MDRLDLGALAGMAGWSEHPALEALTIQRGVGQPDQRSARAVRPEAVGT